uniref:Uncharacterized protein n=1 Tax=Vibrio vulnificus TaxID=672 RepID=A0A6S4PT06_VIBVL|nr:hypothetical protein [Vibrio vulnificus]
MAFFVPSAFQFCVCRQSAFLSAVFRTLILWR